MANIKEISENDLSELRDLLSRIKSTIHKFAHVEELLPKSVINSLENFSDKVEKEFDRRENEF